MARQPVPAALRRHVRQRAGDRCEYCTLSQAGQAATFHVDHVWPTAEGGATTADNLALTCVSCSLRKAARTAAEDPVDRGLVPIFHPRTQSWSQHFRWEGTTVIGLTAIGRATVSALALNRPLILAIRAEEARAGRHPPTTAPHAREA